MPGCCNAQILCCCCGRSCRLCCHFCPPMNESTSTRLMYTLFLVFGTVVMCLMLSPDVLEAIKGVFPEYETACETLHAGQNCERLVGYMAVYRVGFSMAICFFCLAFLTVGITSSDSWRAGLHNGLWALKFLILCGICIATFMIPPEGIHNLARAWMYIGMVGAFIFIIIQLMLIVDFAHAWTDHWHQKVDDGGSRCWFYAMVLCAMVILTVVVAGVIVMARSYTTLEGCRTNKIFIGVNAGLSILCIFVSVLPCVERNTGDSRAGLLQASVISAYVIYLTWSALSSEPSRVEKDDAVFGSPSDQCQPSIGSFHISDDVVSYIGVVIMFFMVLSSTLRTSHYSHKLGIRVPEKTHCCSCCFPAKKMSDVPFVPEVEEIGGQRILRNESERVAYSYSFFNVMCCLASLYIMMLLTHWFSPQGAALSMFERNVSSVWVKMASSWTCILIYLLTLIAPELCPGRLNRSRKQEYEMSSNKSSED